MANRQRLESRRANRDLLQAYILSKQYIGGKQNTKLKSSLIIYTGEPGVSFISLKVMHYFQLCSE